MEVNETNRPLTETPAEETLATSVPTIENNQNVTCTSAQTQEEVIKRLREINENACEADKQEIDQLKQTFYKLHKSDQEAERKAFIEKGGNAEDFTPTPNPLEALFKEIMGEIKEKEVP